MISLDKTKDSKIIARLKSNNKKIYLEDKYVEPVDKRKVKKIMKDMYGKDYEKDDYDEFINEIKIDTNRKFVSEAGDIQIIPDKYKDERQTFYVTGPSGSGKSTFISGYIVEHLKAYPDSRIYLFSDKDDDEKLDKYDLLRVMLDDSLIENPIDIDEFPEDSLVIFDDIDSLSGKLRKSVYALINKLLKVGRSYRISVIVTAHDFSNYNETRSIIQESRYVIVFARFSSSKHHLETFLKTYIGLDKDMIEKVYKSRSRWQGFYRIAPRYMITSDEIEIL